MLFQEFCHYFTFSTFKFTFSTSLSLLMYKKGIFKSMLLRASSLNQCHKSQNFSQLHLDYQFIMLNDRKALLTYDLKIYKRFIEKLIFKSKFGYKLEKLLRLVEYGLNPLELGMSKFLNFSKQHFSKKLSSLVGSPENI